MHPRFFVGIALAAAVVTSPLSAQTPLSAQAGARTAAQTPSPAPARSATPTASQVAAARELFQSIKLEESVANMSAAMVDSEVSHNPGLAPYRDIMVTWLKKYMTWDALLPELTALYTDTYTEAELKALAAFYRSPVGQKSLTKSPELLQRTAALGAKISQPHSAELNGLLTARREELRKAQETAAAKTPGAKGPTPSAGKPAAAPSPRPAATPK